MAGLFLVLDGGEIKTGHVSSLAVKNGAQEAVFFFFLRPYWARQRHSFLQQLTGHKCHAISSQRPDIMLSKSTLTGHFIRYHASPMMGPLLPAEVAQVFVP